MSDTKFITGLIDYLKEHKKNNTIAKVVEAEQDRLSRSEEQTPEMPGKFEVTDKLADDLGKILNIDFTALSRDEFKKGLEIEQEHVDVTQGDPETTAKIALAHLKEMPDYYTKLIAMEKGAGVKEATPPGAEYVVRGLKKSDVAKNPFAIAWWLRNRGAKFRRGPYVGRRMASIESIDKIIEDISKVTTPDLDKVDISKLDQFEKMQYNRMISNSSKEEVLQILINSTEGDFSQLSDELRQYAEKDTTWKNESIEDEEPEEGDITTEDHEHWYQYGKLYFTGDYDGLKKKMDVNKFWPNVFFISDHGNAHLVNELDISKYPKISEFSPVMSKEDLAKYGKDYYVKMANDLEKLDTFTSRQKANNIWKSLDMLSKNEAQTKKAQRVGAIKETLTPAQEALIADLANDVKPYVDKIEARIATTKNHYGDYMALLSQWQKEPKVMMVMAMACKKAGANPQGVNDALRIMTGTAFESVNKTKNRMLNEVCFLVWDKQTNNIKVNTDGDVLQFPNSGKARAYITDVLGETGRYELLPRTNAGVTPKMDRLAFAMEATQDSLKIIARGLMDKLDADRVASMKKGRVIADDKDPKKFMVVVQEANNAPVEHFEMWNIKSNKYVDLGNVTQDEAVAKAKEAFKKDGGVWIIYNLTKDKYVKQIDMISIANENVIDERAMKEAIKKGEPDASDEIVDKIFAKQVATGTGIIFLKQEKDDEQKALIGGKKVKESNASMPVTENSASYEVVPVSVIRVGDTVINKAGQEVTVGKNDIKNDKFMGITLFGDSYKLGTEKITRVVYRNKKVKEGNSDPKEKPPVVCPKCGEPVWDVATVDQRLNKCHNCGLRFDIPELEEKANRKIDLYADGNYLLSTMRYSTVKDAIASVAGKDEVEVAGRGLVPIKGKKIIGKIVTESVMSDVDVEIDDLVKSGANDADIIKVVAGKHHLYPRDIKLAIQKHRMQDTAVERIVEEVYKIWDRIKSDFVKDGDHDAYFTTKDKAREKIIALGPEKHRYEILPESRQLREDVTTLASLSKEFNTPLVDVTQMYNTAKALRLKAVNKTSLDALDANDNKFIISVVRHRLRMRSNGNGGKNA